MKEGHIRSYRLQSTQWEQANGEGAGPGSPVLAVVGLLVGCGAGAIPLHPGHAKRNEVAIVELRTRTSTVVAFDDQPLPRPTAKADGVAVELLPGGHCIQLVTPHLWSAFDPPRSSGQAQPAEVSQAFWFEVKAGAKYVVQDQRLTAQMLDINNVFILDTSEGGRTQLLGLDPALPPKGTTCHPFRSAR